jgi:hypothetical protein
MDEIKGGEAGPLEPERFPKLLRQAHDAEIIDLSQVDDGAYAVKLRLGAEPQISQPGDSQTSEEPAPAPQTSAEAAPAAGPATGIPARSARFRRGSKGPRVAPPDIAKIGVVEVDPNFKPRIELVPASRAVTETLGTGPTTPRSRVDEEAREPRGGGRGSSGGGGDRSRRAGGRGPSGGRERGEREPGERSRGRRGGRGRGGQRVGESSGFERAEPREVPVARPVPAAAAPPPPTPSPSPRPPSEPDTGESFWTKVKRGLTGGT